MAGRGDYFYLSVVYLEYLAIFNNFVDAWYSSFVGADNCTGGFVFQNLDACGVVPVMMGNENVCEFEVFLF